MKKLIIFLNLFVAIFFVTSSVVAQVVVMKPAEQAGVCSPKTISPNGIPCLITAGLTTTVAAPSPYQSCLLDVFYDESICEGITNVYNVSYELLQNCGILEAALDSLEAFPVAQGILIVQIQRKIGKDLAELLANQTTAFTPNPYVFECGNPKKEVVQINYYEAGCFAYCVGYRKKGPFKVRVRKQISCDQRSCCITTSVYCTKDGILQPPVVTTVSEGNGQTCAGAKPNACPVLNQVVWESTSPCFSSCGAPKGKDYFDNNDGTYIYKSIGNQAVFANIYPNPASDEINILFKKSFVGKVILYGINGQMIAVRQPDDNGYLNFNVSNLSKGVYVLAFQAQDGQILTEKVNVQ